MHTEVKIVAVIRLRSGRWSVDFMMGKNRLTDTVSPIHPSIPEVGQTWLANGQGRLIGRK